MQQHIFPAIRLTLVCLVVFSGLYTAAIWGIAQAAPNGGKGEVIVANGGVYYRNIAQNFTEDRYFSSRPSAVGYNAAGAGGSNKGPSNPEYLAEVAARVDTFLAHNPGVQRADIPSDLVTASGGGLDPHISVPAALIQVKRIAQQRQLDENTVRELIRQHTAAPLWGLFGPAKVHVLELNLALDQRTR